MDHPKYDKALIWMSWSSWTSLRESHLWRTSVIVYSYKCIVRSIYLASVARSLHLLKHSDFPHTPYAYAENTLVLGFSTRYVCKCVTLSVNYGPTINYTHSHSHMDYICIKIGDTKLSTLTNTHRKSTRLGWKSYTLLCYRLTGGYRRLSQGGREQMHSGLLSLRMAARLPRASNKS